MVGSGNLLACDRDLGLVGLGSDNVLEQLFQVVAVVGQPSAKVIEQVGVEGRVGHHIDRVDDAAAEQPLPKPVGDSAGEAAILFVGDEVGQLQQALVAWQGCVDGA